jgi:hypothetical protein
MIKPTSIRPDEPFAELWRIDRGSEISKKNRVANQVKPLSRSVKIWIGLSLVFLSLGFFLVGFLLIIF